MAHQIKMRDQVREMESFMQWAAVKAVTTAAASVESLLALTMRQMMEHTSTGCTGIHGYICRRDVGR